MKTVLLKIIIGLAVLTAAAFGMKGCDINTYDPAYSDCYLDLVSDYSEVVPADEWGK
jgi:hypothetical protein